MYAIQDHFPDTFAATFSRDGFRYSFRDVPQTRFAVAFCRGVFGDVSGHVVCGSVPRDGVRSRVSCTVSGTFVRYDFPETFRQSRLIGCVLRRFRKRFQMRLPEPLYRRHLPGTFMKTLPRRLFCCGGGNCSTCEIPLLAPAIRMFSGVPSPDVFCPG